MYFKRIILLSLLVLTAVSCKKKKDPEPVSGFTLSNGMLVLCEGLFQQNNSTLSWIDFNASTTHNDIFSAQIGRGLGDTGNDMIRYGSKLYVLVNVSSTIEVVNAMTFKEIQQIPMVQSGTAKQPRYMLPHNGKVYITCFDGYVDVLDTASLTITQRIPVGLNPEGITLANNLIYVSNSGGLNTPEMDSTVSIIDPNTNLEIDRITVGMNPGAISADPNGNVYVIARGNHSTVPADLIKIEASLQTTSLGIEPSYLANYGNQFLLVYKNSGTNHLRVFTPGGDVLASSDLIDLSPIQTFYGMHYIPSINQIAVFDAMSYVNSGKLRMYSASGSLLSTYSLGLNPSKLLYFE